MPVKYVDIPKIGTVSLYKRRGSRSIRLTVSADNKVRVTLPYWVPYSAALDFLNTKLDWLEERQIKTENIGHGDGIGKAHRVSLLPMPSYLAPSTTVRNGSITLKFHDELDWQSEELQEKLRKACLRALKIEAERLLPIRLTELARIHGFEFNSVSTRQLKGRWGSCSHKKHIVLNVYLMQLPWQLIDYVILHELTHTKFLNHSPEFWSDLERVLPKAKTLRKTLRSHHPVLKAQKNKTLMA